MSLARKQVKPAALVLTYASAITLDVVEYDSFWVTLTGDVSFIFAHAANGQRGEVWVRQNATGGWRAGFVAPLGFTINEGAAGTATASGANAITRFDYVITNSVIDIDASPRTLTVNLVTYSGAQVTTSGNRVIKA
jgi:hypothetical protein